MRTLFLCLLGLVTGLLTANGQTNTVDFHHGEYVEYDLRICTNRLSSARLVLRGEPRGPFLMPQKGEQGARGNTDFTVYTDIDGDSLFDAMVQNRKTDARSYILYSNTWTEVETTMSRFGAGEVRHSVSDNKKYIFRGHAWELLETDNGKHP